MAFILNFDDLDDFYEIDLAYLLISSIIIQCIPKENLGLDF